MPKSILARATGRGRGEPKSLLALACEQIEALAEACVDFRRRIADLEARAPVPGPQGDPGPQGEVGPEGPAGRDGRDADPAILEALRNEMDGLRLNTLTELAALSERCEEIRQLATQALTMAQQPVVKTLTHERDPETNRIVRSTVTETRTE